jgi:hypothetical protein
LYRKKEALGEAFKGKRFRRKKLDSKKSQEVEENESECLSWF